MTRRPGSIPAEGCEFETHGYGAAPAGVGHHVASVETIDCGHNPGDVVALRGGRILIITHGMETAECFEVGAYESLEAFYADEQAAWETTSLDSNGAPGFLTVPDGAA